MNKWMNKQMLKGELMFLTLALSMLPSLAGVPGLLPTSLWFRELQIQFETFCSEKSIKKFLSIWSFDTNWLSRL